jgi:hypothetical protein
MNDYPTPIASPTEYGSPPKGMEDECCAMCEGKTADELDQLSNYFGKKSSEMRQGLASKVTYEDFEKITKGDRESEGEIE